MTAQTTLERIAMAISGAPFPTNKSLEKARSALKAFLDATEECVSAGVGHKVLNDPDDYGVCQEVETRLDDVATILGAVVQAALDGK